MLFLSEEGLRHIQVFSAVMCGTSCAQPCIHYKGVSLHAQITAVAPARFALSMPCFSVRMSSAPLSATHTSQCTSTQFTQDGEADGRARPAAARCDNRGQAVCQASFGRGAGWTDRQHALSYMKTCSNDRMMGTCCPGKQATASLVPATVNSYPAVCP